MIYKRILKFLYPTTYIHRSRNQDLEDDYSKYESLMLQKRPFKLVMKYNRKIDRHYSRMEYKYSSEIDINDEITL
jgi:hypothetical protein